MPCFSSMHVLPNTWGVVHRLFSIRLFSVLDVEPEEITQFRRSIDLGLPCVLSLPNHCCSHDFISVLGRDQICCLEEDSSAVGERKVRP